MPLKMAGLIRTSDGRYSARKRIPKDVRAEYQRIFGAAWEAKLSLPRKVPLAEAKARFSEWLSEIETRIEAIRARGRGEGQGLTHKQARALAGEWYQQFVARHEDSPGDAEGWARAFDDLTDEMEDWLPDETRERRDLGEWLANEFVRANIRPLIADRAGTAQFLANKGIVLTPEARDVFLDCVTENYVEAVTLLHRRAKGDYAPDNLPRAFPQFSGPKKVSHGGGSNPWALFEQWVKEAKPAESTVSRWRAVFLTMTEHFKNKGADDIDEHAAREWARNLITEDRTAETVSEVWIKRSPSRVQVG